MESILKKVSKQLNYVLICSLPIFLLGCTSKPPSCEDSSTIEVLRSLVIQNLKGKITDKSKLDELIKTGAKESESIYFQNIRNNGFNENQNKFSCAADAILALRIDSNSETMKQLSELVHIADTGETGGLLYKIGIFELQAIGRKSGLDDISNLKGVQIRGNEISAPITYTSSFATNNNSKQQFVESVGVMPLINAGYAFSNLYSPSNSTNQSQAQPSVVIPTAGDVTGSKKMLGELVDKNTSAEPNTPEDIKNKKSGRNWQDKNGFMHYADGSASSGPVD